MRRWSLSLVAFVGAATSQASRLTWNASRIDSAPAAASTRALAAFCDAGGIGLLLGRADPEVWALVAAAFPERHDLARAALVDFAARAQADGDERHSASEYVGGLQDCLHDAQASEGAAEVLVGLACMEEGAGGLGERAVTSLASTLARSFSPSRVVTSCRSFTNVLEKLVSGWREDLLLADNEVAARAPVRALRYMMIALGSIDAAKALVDVGMSGPLPSVRREVADTLGKRDALEVLKRHTYLRDAVIPGLRSAVPLETDEGTASTMVRALVDAMIVLGSLDAAIALAEVGLGHRDVQVRQQVADELGRRSTLEALERDAALRDVIVSGLRSSLCAQTCESAADTTVRVLGDVMITLGSLDAAKALAEVGLRHDITRVRQQVVGTFEMRNALWMLEQDRDLRDIIVSGLRSSLSVETDNDVAGAIVRALSDLMIALESVDAAMALAEVGLRHGYARVRQEVVGELGRRSVLETRAVALGLRSALAAETDKIAALSMVRKISDAIDDGAVAEVRALAEVGLRHNIPRVRQEVAGVLGKRGVLEALQGDGDLHDVVVSGLRWSLSQENDMRMVRVIVAALIAAIREYGSRDAAMALVEAGLRARQLNVRQQVVDALEQHLSFGETLAQNRNVRSVIVHSLLSAGNREWDVELKNKMLRAYQRHSVSD